MRGERTGIIAVTKEVALAGTASAWDEASGRSRNTCKQPPRWWWWSAIDRPHAAYDAARDGMPKRARMDEVLTAGALRASPMPIG